MQFGRLLSESDINRVKDRFNEDTSVVLEEAIRKHHNLGGGGTPLWLYVTLAYFAYDDIFRMLANPILFYPLVFIFSIISMLYSIGLGPVMVPMFKSTTNMVMRRCGLPGAF